MVGMILRPNGQVRRASRGRLAEREMEWGSRFRFGMGAEAAAVVPHDIDFSSSISAIGIFLMGNAVCTNVKSVGEVLA